MLTDRYGLAVSTTVAAARDAYIEGVDLLLTVYPGAAAAFDRAIAADPEIIFFDEPTTGLDPIMADVINDLIASTVKDVGATALSITHDMASARKISDRIAMLYGGKIIWQGPTADIDKSGNPYVDQFINGRAEGPIKMAVKA